MDFNDIDDVVAGECDGIDGCGGDNVGDGGDSDAELEDELIEGFSPIEGIHEELTMTDECPKFHNNPDVLKLRYYRYHYDTPLPDTLSRKFLVGDEIDKTHEHLMSGKPFEFLPLVTQEPFKTAPYMLTLIGADSGGAKIILNINVKPTFYVRSKRVKTLSKRGRKQYFHSDENTNLAENPIDSEEEGIIHTDHDNWMTGITSLADFDKEKLIDTTDIENDHIRPLKRHKNYEILVRDICDQLRLATTTGKYKKPINFNIKNPTEPFLGKPLKGYSEKDSEWVIVECNSVEELTCAIHLLRHVGFDLAYDDTSSYYRKISRESGIPLANWLTVKNYKYVNEPISYVDFQYINAADNIANGIPLHKTRHNAVFVLEANINDVVPFEGEVLERKDGTLIMTWDIEAYSPNKSGSLPSPKEDDDVAFMLCMTIHRQDETRPLMNITVTMADSEPDPRWLTIKTANQSDLISVFGKLIGRFAPEIIIGFNDLNFDWNFIREKAMKFTKVWDCNKRCMLGTGGKKGAAACMCERKKINCIYRFIDDTICTQIPGQHKGFAVCSAVSDAITNPMDPNNNDIDTVKSKTSMYIHDRVSIKLTAETTETRNNYPKIPGTICMDVSLIFGKLFPKGDSSPGKSLNAYLKKCNLPSKAEMTIKDMWSFYAEWLAIGGNNYDKQNDAVVAKWRYIGKGMRKIAHYCVIDSFRCFQLLKVRFVVSDYRENASISYTSFEDAYIRAGGLKVRNLLMAYALRANIMCPTYVESSEKNYKYPGAHVIKPETGLETRWPVFALDFASLYPSVMMAYNLSPNTIINSFRGYRRALKAGKKLAKIEFTYGEREVLAWSVRHNGDMDKMGIYPKVLIELAALRSKAKKLMAPYEERKKELISEGKTDTEEYNDVIAKFSYYNAKQNAYKVFMNTFYGEAGNARSPFFMVELAGGTTYYGKENLRFVEQLFKKQGFHIKYGDTDSIYSCPGEFHFVEEKADYERELATLGELATMKDLPAACNIERKYEAKKRYWKRMVEKTMVIANEFMEYVNNALFEDNGTRYLKMAFEEVLFPVLFLCKKKYAGWPHVKFANIVDRNTSLPAIIAGLFVRGIDIIKQGQTELAKTIGYKILTKAILLETEDVLGSGALMTKIVENALREVVFNTDLPTEHFILTGTYKPDKHNSAIVNFMKMMTMRNEIEKVKAIHENREPSRLFVPPEGGDKFQYILVDPKHNLFPKTTTEGKKFDVKNYHMMMYLSTARELGIKPLIPMYILKYIVGLCARFVDCETNAVDLKIIATDEEEREKEIDRKRLQKARLGIGKIIESVIAVDNDFKDISQKYRVHGHAETRSMVIKRIQGTGDILTKFAIRLLLAKGGLQHDIMINTFVEAITRSQGINTDTCRRSKTGAPLRSADPLTARFQKDLTTSFAPVLEMIKIMVMNIQSNEQLIMHEHMVGYMDDLAELCIEFDTFFKVCLYETYRYVLPRSSGTRPTMRRRDEPLPNDSYIFRPSEKSLKTLRMMRDFLYPDIKKSP